MEENLNITIMDFIPCGLFCLALIIKSVTKCVSQIVRTKYICEHAELTDDQVKHIAHMDAKTIF